MTCWFWHSWGKWVVMDRGQIRKDEKLIGYTLTQERSCQKCGFVQRNMHQRTVYDFSD